MWLTSREICHELRISELVLTKMRKRRKIQFINIGSDKTPAYRYKLPAPSALADPVPQIERQGLFTYQEVAAILGMSQIGVRVAVSDKRINRVLVGKRGYITMLELRRVLAEREKRTGQAKRGVSNILVGWLREYLASEKTPTQTLQALIDEAVKLPEPERSKYITALWDYFDRVNALLDEIHVKVRED
jgi:hypothetical protein